ncbi:DUF6116 family protein [Luteimonas arsenica]|uniref:DUF6116 family protein n=1 Tax=Luteimonas arsenica TaxID=1586242 RepID=UPI001055815F|nr:DUF6116 family protein [Luteimonas arsenica]
MPNPILAPVLRWLGRLSYPKLFVLAAGLFVLNLFVPDPLPFVDELLLGIGALMISRRKRKPDPAQARVIDGEARRG